MKFLLATDFDGTIAPIQQDPEKVSIDREALALLQEVGALADVELALVSGRSLDDLRSRSGGVQAWRAGSHGLEIADPNGRIVTQPSRSMPSLDDTLSSQISSAKLRVEQKKYGVAIHWRGIDVPDDHPVIQQFAEWATGRDLKLTRGRKVLEASVPGGGKREAIRAIESQVKPDLLIYAGDDLTDFEALEYVAERGGAAFLVVTPERPERPAGNIGLVSSTSELVTQLRALLVSDE